MVRSWVRSLEPQEIEIEVEIEVEVETETEAEKETEVEVETETEKEIETEVEVEIRQQEGWRGGPEVKSMFCSCKEHGLQLQLQGI